MVSIGAQRPYFLPDFYFFYKIYLCDIFIVNDQLLFRKQSPIVRTKLSGDIPPKYLTIPVKHNKIEPQPHLPDVEVISSKVWKDQHLKTLKSMYRKTPFFEFYYDKLEEIYSQNYTRLVEILSEIINWQVKILFPGKLIKYTSGLGLKNTINLQKYLSHFNEPVFLVYPEERGYYENKFHQIRKEDIVCKNVCFPDGYHPEMSLLVLLFLIGPETIFYFKKKV